MIRCEEDSVSTVVAFFLSKHSQIKFQSDSNPLQEVSARWERERRSVIIMWAERVAWLEVMGSSAWLFLPKRC